MGNISSVIIDAFVNYDNTNPSVVEIELQVIDTYNKLHVHHVVTDR